MLTLFHSLEFFPFLVATVVVHWGVARRFQNSALLLASYVFYTSVDWRMSLVLLASTLLDYGVGLRLHAASTSGGRRAWLAVSIVGNLGLLCVFRYYNFFVESVNGLLMGIGVEGALSSLEIFLPLGISFYTFQTMSYCLDIHARKLQPTRSFVDFALFVAFFPQLVAGPIEKARNLLPQIEAPRSVRDVPWAEGLYLFVLGFFLKAGVADYLKDTMRFLEPKAGMTGSEAFISSLFYCFIIYTDFSGYTKMGRGTACLLGIRLSRNFFTPFFAGSYMDFYQRWHITLSAWIGEYVYQPLYHGLIRSRLSFLVSNTRVRLSLCALLALFVTRMIFAMWHGPTLNFALLGLWIFAAQALTLGAKMVCDSRGIYFDRVPAPLKGAASTLTFVAVFGIAMIFFRFHSPGEITLVLTALIRGPYEVAPFAYFLGGFFVISLVWLYDYLQYKSNDELFLLNRASVPVRVAVIAYMLYFAMIVVHYPTSQFIYAAF